MLKIYLKIYNIKINIKYTDRFLKDIKKLIKKYKNVENDVNNLISELEKNPKFGIELGNGFYKIRIKNSDNNKGKSGGYRTIIYYDNGINVVLMTIYSKNEQDSIGDNELLEILQIYNKKK